MKISTFQTVPFLPFFDEKYSNPSMYHVTTIMMDLIPTNWLSSVRIRKLVLIIMLLIN